MEWSNDFLVNEHTLDMHHKKLFNEINNLKKILQYQNQNS